MHLPKVFPSLRYNDRLEINSFIDSDNLSIVAAVNGDFNHILLSKKDAIRLAAEIASWCETGEFIKPKKKKTVVVFKPSCYPIETIVIEGNSEAEVMTHFWFDRNSDNVTLIGLLPIPENK